MAVLCPQYGLLYLCVPKTGSSSVSRFLMDHAGGQWLPEEHIFNRRGEIVADRKHATLDQLKEHGLLSEEEIQKLTILISVRNPFDLVLSNYFFEKKIYREFRAGIRGRSLPGRRFYFYLRDRFRLDRDNHYSWIMPQASRYRFTSRNSFTDYVKKYYAGKKGTMFLHFTGGTPFEFIKQEQLESGLAGMLKSKGYEKEIELPRLSESRNSPSRRKLYTDEARAIIEHRYSDELEMFGYSF